MTKQRREMTTTSLVATASDFLEKNGYSLVPAEYPDWRTTTSRLYEDIYSVVGVVVFQTCSDLMRSWPELQGSMVDIIAHSIGKAEGKAWDGYLVLLTPAPTLTTEQSLDSIRKDTRHLRKLVASGDDIRSASDLERLLSTLLPLRSEAPALGPETILQNLNTLLERQGISNSVTTQIVDAFVTGKPLLKTLHELRETK